MWRYGMIDYGGWMFFWWIGSPLLFGAVAYTAVRLGTHHMRRDEYDYYPGLRDCRGDDRHYHQDDARYRDDYR